MLVQDLSFAYQKNQPILNGVNLHLEAGEKHGILGSNGAGKTTFFRLVSGQLPCTSGAITWDGQPITRQQVSFLEAEPYFYPYMTGHEYLRFLNDQPQQIDQWNTLFALPLEQYAEEYSTGMKKKLGLMGVLLQSERPVLILDEPFNGVDFESNEIIMAVLQHPVLQARTMMISSHILPTLTRVCHRISVLSGGTIVRTYAQAEFGELEALIQSDVTDRVGKVIGRL